jgi:hypothetical protein
MNFKTKLKDADMEIVKNINVFGQTSYHLTPQTYFHNQRVSNSDDLYERNNFEKRKAKVQ